MIWHCLFHSKEELGILLSLSVKTKIILSTFWKLIDTANKMHIKTTIISTIALSVIKLGIFPFIVSQDNIITVKKNRPVVAAKV